MSDNTNAAGEPATNKVTRGALSETYIAVARRSGLPAPRNIALYGRFRTMEEAEEGERGARGGRIVRVTQTTEWEPADGPLPVGIGSIGREIRTDCPRCFRRYVSREMVVFAETKAYWKARPNEPGPTYERWFRKRDLVSEPRRSFPTAFEPI